MRILARIFYIYNVHNFKLCNFHRFHCSSILNNNSCRSFCKFLQENGKTTNLQIQREQQLDYSSTFSTFRRLSQTPLNDELLKQEAKWNFSIAKFSTRKEHSEKPITLGIETKDYLMGRKINILEIKIRHNKKNGDKWIRLCHKIPFNNYSLPNIAIKEAYLLIEAMDSLMNKLAEHENNHPTCEEFINNGLYYDYKLNINPNKNGHLKFTMESIGKQTQKKVLRIFPIRLLPLIRDRMAKLLVEFDGTEIIGLPPTPLPKWITEDDKNKTAENVNKLRQADLYRDTLDYKVEDKPRDRKILIEYRRGASGKEYIAISQAFNKRMDIGNVKNLYFHFANIPIQDAKPLLCAMEIISNDLPQIGQNNKSSIICYQLIEGLKFDYKLEIHSSPNNQLDFRWQTLLNTDKFQMHVPIKLYGPVPIEVFHWLREQMAEILLVSSNASNKFGQSFNTTADENQGAEPTSNLEFNYLEKEILHFEKLPYIDYYEGERNTMFVFIEMHQSKNKRKSIYLYKWLHFITHKFARIFVPQDAYSMVRAMDELMSKLIDQEKPPNCAIFVRDREGLVYNYKLGIRPNPKKNGDLQFIIESITTGINPNHQSKEFFVPIRLIPLLRDRIAKMLKEFDETEEIGPTPSPLPKWVLEKEETINDMSNAYGVNKDKEKWEILRQETFDFSVYVNTIIGKQDRKMIIRLQRNKWGQEFIQIVQEFDKQLESLNIAEDKSYFVYFPPIPVKIAYHLLDAMYKLSNDSDKKCAALQISDEILAKRDQRNINKLVICQQRVSGIHYDYQLEIQISPLTKQLDFNLLTTKTKADPLHEPRKLYGPIPMNVFNWLKEKMVELLKSSSNQQEQNTHRVEQFEFDENVDAKMPIACKEEANNGMHERLIRYESKDYMMDIEPQDRQIQIKHQQGKSGKKFILIVQRYIGKDGVPHFLNFPKILIPEDAFCLLDAMRTMSIELKEKRTAFLNGENKSSMLCQQIVSGFNYDYKLEIHKNKNQKLHFRFETMGKINSERPHKPKILYGPIPFDIFIWLKDKMAEILEDYDKSNGNEKNR